MKVNAITEVAVVPDPKTQFKVVFNMVKTIDDQDVLAALMERSKEEVEKAIATAGDMGGDEQTTTTDTSNSKY